MNNNIFSPKGQINELFFILYYILLMAIYLIGGYFAFTYIYNHNISSAFLAVPVLLLKLLFLFNYKKRLSHIGANLLTAIILAIILTFDSETVVLCGLIKDSAASSVLFWTLTMFFYIIQPVVLAIIPCKKEENL